MIYNVLRMSNFGASYINVSLFFSPLLKVMSLGRSSKCFIKLIKKLMGLE